MGHMFSALVSGNGDVSGALAYADYKRSKIEWRVRFRSQHMHEPDAADEEAFIQIQMLSVNIENFRRRGDRAAAQYLTEALKDKVAPLALEVYQSELSGKFAVLEERVQSSLQQIQSQLNEKKTFGGWMKEIGTAFVSSLALVAIVGAILTGYVGLAKLTASVEKAVGLGTNPAYKAAFEKPIPTPRSPQDGD